MAANNFISESEHLRLMRAQQQKLDDERIAAMAGNDGERVAVLEAEMRHREKFEEETLEALKMMNKEMAELRDVLTKASGVKLAFMVFIGGVGFALSQFWQFVSWSRP